MERDKGEIVKRAEKLVKEVMKDNDASHDASHVFRVRDMALSLAVEEGLSSSPHSFFIVELAALLHDIGDYKYARDSSEERLIEQFLEEEGIEEDKKMKIVGIVKAMDNCVQLQRFLGKKRLFLGARSNNDLTHSKKTEMI